VLDADWCFAGAPPQPGQHYVRLSKGLIGGFTLVSEADIERISRLIEKGRSVAATRRPAPRGVIGRDRVNSGAFTGWATQSLTFLESVLDSDHAYIRTFARLAATPTPSNADQGLEILQAVREDLEKGFLETEERLDPWFPIELICNHFHLIARQLRARHNGRPTLNVTDEYDVQDLIHALLRLYFEDVRPEEYTPSYAGGSSRMDFLLKLERIVIEVKKTRDTMTPRELGNQLIEDIARYQEHPDCKLLVCFVYDPEGLIPNPRGIEGDLNRDNPIPVRVLIRPQ